MTSVGLGVRVTPRLATNVGVASGSLQSGLFLVVAFLCGLVCRLLELVVLLARGERSKELEIFALRHERAILRRQVTGRSRCCGS